MVLRVKPTPDQQSLYPDGQHTLAFYIKCVPPVGLSDDVAPHRKTKRPTLDNGVIFV